MPFGGGESGNQAQERLVERDTTEEREERSLTDVVMTSDAMITHQVRHDDG